MKLSVRLLVVCHLVVSSCLFAAGIGTGRGGVFLEYHAASLGAFDPQLSGNPMVIGGEGFGSLTKSFRIGGGGGGGFLWNSSNNVNFGMGYGGAIAEYTVLPWLNARLLIGGGGFSVSKTLSQTDTTTVVQKINSGGFLLFYPSFTGEVALDKSTFLGFNVGYFLPNVSQLQGATLGLSLIFGKM